MNIVDRKAAIRHLVPGARMDTFGDEITWLDDRPMPSDAEIVAAHKQVLLGGARTAAIERVEAGYRQALAALHRDYPDIEREGWAEQVADARAHQADQDAPLLAAMATARGISPDDLAARILSKHQQYRTAYAGPTGTLGKLRDEVAAAETVEALEAIDWPT